jgi:hypothetical protein
MEVLAQAGWIEEDRRPPIQMWAERRIKDLPETMRAELRIWLDVMLRGNKSSPRMRPRSPNTISVYLGQAMPLLTAWAAAGHTSLREVSRQDVVGALPASGTPRALQGNAIKSIFRILKARKVIFANPAARVHTGYVERNDPLPANVDAVRAALLSNDPARAALVGIAAFHGVRSADLRGFLLTDYRDGKLSTGSRVIHLADPVSTRLRAYLDYRAAKWPDSINPHLFINQRSAGRTNPVGSRWIYLKVDLDGSIEALREDRILDQTFANGGDIRELQELFGISVMSTRRYIAALDNPDFM